MHQKMSVKTTLAGEGRPQTKARTLRKKTKKQANKESPDGKDWAYPELFDEICHTDQCTRL